MLNINNLCSITKDMFQLLSEFSRSFVYYGCKERDSMNQKQMSNAQIGRTRTSRERKPTALEEQQVFETSVVEPTANTVVEVSLT